jgi:predicted aspartyl protease
MVEVKPLAWICAALSCLLLAATAMADCKMLQIAELPVSVVRNRLLIDAQINDQPVKIMVDTGSSYSFLWESEARRLDLPLRPASGIHIYGVGGEARVLATEVKHMQIGAFSFKDMSLAVIATGQGLGRLDAALVLGEDFFSKFTTEFDLAHGAIRLFKPEGCKPEQLVYWGAAYSLAQLERVDGNVPSITTDVVLNSQHIMALLDTGAPTSHISRSASERAGVTPALNQLAPDSVRGVAGRKIDSWVGTFGSFTIGDEVIHNVKLRIADLFGRDTVRDTGSNLARPVEGLPSMIIGCDFFLAHRILVLFSEHKLLFSFNHGPIFQTIESIELPVAGSGSSSGSP